ncbi:MAG: serine hydrolase [Bacteroidota bacterium]
MKYLLLLLSLLTVCICQAQQTSERLIEEMKAAIKAETYSKIDGILVSQGGELQLETYFNDFDEQGRHDTRSAFKSITSMLAGIAIDQGILTLDDNLGTFFPEVTDSTKQTISLQNLLEMRSGLNCEEFLGIGPDCEGEMWDTDNWIEYCLNVPIKSAPGMNFSYNSNEPMLVGEIISRASGMSVMDFAAKNLFAPLGITDYKWTIAPEGSGMTAGSFYMLPRDMLKIAELVRNKGQWEGKQIVSETWLDQSTACQFTIDFSFTRYSRFHQAKYSNTCYGYFWYREVIQYDDIQTEVLFASGNGGQYMMYLADYDATVVFTGSNYGSWRGKWPFEILLRYIIPMLEETD